MLDERGGAAEAILAARDEGLTRFVGVTGHDLGAPAAHLEALRRYDLDTVMFPVYPAVWADPVYRADAEALLGECAARDAGVMAIKAVARRPWGDQAPFADSWYEPWAEPGTVARGVGFALSTPGVHAFCTPGDLDGAAARARCRGVVHDPRRRRAGGGDGRDGLRRGDLPARGQGQAGARSRSAGTG